MRNNRVRPTVMGERGGINLDMIPKQMVSFKAEKKIQYVLLTMNPLKSLLHVKCLLQNRTSWTSITKLFAIAGAICCRKQSRFVQPHNYFFQ